MLIRIQKEIDAETPVPTSNVQTRTKTKPIPVNVAQLIYNFVKPQEDKEVEQEAAAARENSSWRYDGKMYDKANISPPLAGMSMGGTTPIHG